MNVFVLIDREIDTYQQLYRIKIDNSYDIVGITKCSFTLLLLINVME